MTKATGLLADYGLTDDAYEDLPEGFGYSVADGTYEFEVGDMFIKEGWTDNDDARALIIEYLLSGEDSDGKDVDGKKVSDWFTLPPEDADPSEYTDQEKRNLRNMIDRFADFGVPRHLVNKVGPDEIVGLTGQLTLRTRQGKGKYKGKEFQNIVAFTVDEPLDASTLGGAPKAAPAAAAAKPTRTRRAGERAEAEASAEPEADFEGARRSRRRA